MTKQIGVLIMCVSVLIYACGCSSVRDVSMAEFKKDPQSGIKSVRLRSGETLAFDGPSRLDGFYSGGSIMGAVATGKMISVPESTIDSVRYSHPETGKTMAVLAGGAIIVVGAILFFTLDFSLGPMTTKLK